ncbi:Glutathione S-transferase zeta-1 [Rhizopus azygosporus]|uniref:Glutathione S-transferase zeta-1 n=1 Tax=Rhizopus azygosporus TaxID=86630 RepID=A0A367JYY6_RHIAZ|nr:Glutathione S-transferase zeta-1 [Rhizopus azygosporus]
MSEQKPALYGYFRSSASYRVRIVLEIKGVEYDQKIVNLLKKEQFSEEYKKVVPTQKVPAFVTKEGRVILQSQAIVDYIDDVYPGPSLYPKDPLDRAYVREICQIIACDIHPLQNLGVLQRVAPDNQEEQNAFAKEMITKAFYGLEARLAKVSSKYSFGDTLTMADVFVVPMVYNAMRRDVDMSQFPILSRLYDTVSALPEFKRASPSAQPDCPPELK